MRYILSRSIPVFAAALLFSGCIVGDFDFGSSDRYQTDFHYSFNVEPDARLDLENFNGSVEISGWDDNKVDISGAKYASTEQLRDALKIDTHNTPSAIEIRTVRPSSHMGGYGARYVIRVPRKARLDRIVTSNGSIRIRDVASASHLKSSNGSVHAQNVNGDVEAHTSNSSIELDSIRGNATLKTSNGRIQAENIAGNCDAETSNNSIKVRFENATTSPVRLVTSNGSIELDMRMAPKSDIRAETRNGGITVNLPSSTSARISADTSNNSVSSDFDIRSESSDDRKHHLEGVIGSGGPKVDLSTRNGHIRIVKGSGE